MADRVGKVNGKNLPHFDALKTNYLYRFIERELQSPFSRSSLMGLVGQRWNVKDLREMVKNELFMK